MREKKRRSDNAKTYRTTKRHKQKEDKKREPQPDTRKTKKQNKEIRNTIHDSLLRQKRKEKLKWDQALQDLKKTAQQNKSVLGGNSG
jgi:hypothetical protein